MPPLQRCITRPCGFRIDSATKHRHSLCRARGLSQTTTNVMFVDAGFRRPFLTGWMPNLAGSTTGWTRYVSSHVIKSQAGERSSPPPFDKVLIANRGEIAQRIMRTCHAMGIDTVAVHSTADVKAPFVVQADEAICIGPALASASYLHVPAIVDAIQQTGAQAVHPGYGFLSENANFAQTIQEETGAVFLGPPVHAIQKLGDKLESKLLAAESGVNVIPGYEGAVESIDHAIQLCQDQVPFPVLLKAAAGGGGKGMRVCYNEGDIRDAWNVAKAEALNFFKDDRLLIEKYIERPHHIEFQVMAAPGNDPGDTDVVVFPERECSIQRRNQKIIEESPSVLLSDETRKAMAKQVRELCKTVGYRSAGTVEFLVDEEQNFFFLEMNTRLQVEAPITESICGVDLVKAMLYVGAGWGLPEEMRAYTDCMMPYSGHAMEARIYAEDPLRGFLPSTGPLTQYVEPSIDHNTIDRYVRIDSGVAVGHVVTPHYDPMLSKVIFRGNDRNDAISGLAGALDEYVIEGVQHNARLVRSVLRHPAFITGQTPTSFLPQHYPEGFSGVDLTPVEQMEFALSAALISLARQKILHASPLAANSCDGHVVIVRLGGMFGPAWQVTIEDSSAKVQVLDNYEHMERKISIDGPIDYNFQNYLAMIVLNGKARTVQVLSQAATGEFRMQMYGADTIVLVQSPREYELSAYMKEPLIMDTSDRIVSPMPGTLISFAVQVGDHVQPGQELCVVEAMKMQNIIRSPRVGTIASLDVAVGSSLLADATILKFENTREDT